MAIVALIVLFLGLCLYLLPAIIAEKRGKRDTTAIVALNILVGWTFIGWIIALVWALKEDGPKGSSTVVVNNIRQESQGKNQPPVKKCPYCAEIILAEAIVCKHCGRDLPKVQDSENQKPPATKELVTNESGSKKKRLFSDS